MSDTSKKIPNFPRYEVTSDGEVFNKSGLKLKPDKTRNGYLRVSLSNESTKHKRFSIHRLVAEAFIPNPDNLPQVDHKNEIKTDNHIGNLRWSTPLDNLNHSSVIDKASIAKYRKVLCVTTGKVYNSVKEAADELGLYHSNIVACCNNRRHRCGGMEWKYVE